MQKNGWVVGIMTEHARSIQAMDCDEPVGSILDCEVLRSMIMDNLWVMLINGRIEPGDGCEPDERVYWISKKLGGALTIPMLRFIAPSGQKIRRIKVERVEQNKKVKEKAVRMERSEIGRGIRRPTKATRQPDAASTQRRNRL